MSAERTEEKIGRWLIARRRDDDRSGHPWWRITNTRGQPIGYVHWYVFWKCHVFVPMPDVALSHDCLADLASFCARLTSERQNR